MQTKIQQYTDKQISTLPIGLQEILHQKDSIIQALIQRLHKQEQQLISANALLSEAPSNQSQVYTEYILSDLKAEGFLQTVGDRLLLSMDVTEIDNGDVISNSFEKIIVDSRCKIVRVNAGNEDHQKFQEMFEKMSKEIQQIKKMGEEKLKTQIHRLEALEKENIQKSSKKIRRIPSISKSDEPQKQSNLGSAQSKSTHKIDDFMLRDPTNSQIYECEVDLKQTTGLKRAVEDEIPSPRQEIIKHTDSFIQKNENGQSSNDAQPVSKPLTHTFGGPPDPANPKNRIKKLIRHRY